MPPKTAKKPLKKSTTGTTKSAVVPRSRKPRKIGTVYHFTTLRALGGITDDFKSKNPFLKFGKEFAPQNEKIAKQIMISTTKRFDIFKLQYGNIRFTLDGDKIAKDFEIEYMEVHKGSKLHEERILARNSKQVLSLLKYCTSVVISTNVNDDTMFGSAYDLRYNPEVIESCREYFGKLGIPFSTVKKFTK